MQEDKKNLSQEISTDAKIDLNIRVTLEIPPESSHDPFALRKVLVMCAAVPAAVVAFLLDNVFWAVALYFVLVTTFDAAVGVLRLKPSRGVDPEKLLASEGVTPEQFDTYCATRRWIRYASLSAACLTAPLGLGLWPAHLPAIFCETYVLLTLAGILWVRLLKIPRPKVFHQDDRYYVPCHRTPGRISAAEFSLATTGSGPMGVYES